MGLSDDDITTEPRPVEGPADGGAKGIPDVRDGGADGGADEGADRRLARGPVDTVEEGRRGHD